MQEISKPLFLSGRHGHKNCPGSPWSPDDLGAWLSWQSTFVSFTSSIVLFFCIFNPFTHFRYPENSLIAARCLPVVATWCFHRVVSAGCGLHWTCDFYAVGAARTRNIDDSVSWRCIEGSSNPWVQSNARTQIRNRRLYQPCQPNFVELCRASLATTTARPR